MSVFCWLVSQQQHAGRGRLAVTEAQRDWPGCLPEQSLSGAQHQRVHEQAEFVNQVVLDQRLHQNSAAEDHKRAVPMVLEFADRRGRVAR